MNHPPDASIEHQMTLQQLKRLAIHHLQFSEPEKSLQFLLRALQLDRTDEDSFRMTVYFVENWDVIFGPQSAKYDRIKTLLEKVVNAVDENQQKKEAKAKKAKRKQAKSARPQSAAPVPNFDSVSSILAMNKDALQGWDSAPGSVANEIAAQNRKRKKAATSRPASSTTPNARSSFMYSELLYPSAVLSLGIPASDAMTLESVRVPQVSPSHGEERPKHRPHSASISTTASPYTVLNHVREGGAAPRPQSASRFSRRKQSGNGRQGSATRSSKPRPHSAAVIHPGVTQQSLPQNPHIPHIPSQHLITDIVLKKERPSMSPYKSYEFDRASPSNHARPKSSSSSRSARKNKRPQSAGGTKRSKLQRVPVKQTEEQRRYIEEQNRLIESLRKQLHNQSFLADPAHKPEEEEEESEPEISGFQSTLRAHVTRNPFATPDVHGPLLEEAEEIERAKFIQNMERHIQQRYPTFADKEVSHNIEQDSAPRRMSAAILQVASSNAVEPRKSSPKKERQQHTAETVVVLPVTESSPPREKSSLRHGERHETSGVNVPEMSFIDRIAMIENEAVRQDRLKFLVEFSYPGLRASGGK